MVHSFPQSLVKLVLFICFNYHSVKLNSKSLTSEIIAIENESVICNYFIKCSDICCQFPRDRITEITVSLHNFA